MKFIMLTAFLAVAVVTYAQPFQKATRGMRFADSLFTARDWYGAARAYERVLKAAPDNSLAWNRLGYSYQCISYQDKALASYLKALEYKPAPALECVVQARMARLYSLKDDGEKAFQCLDRALQLGYSNINELESHNDFNNIRADARFENVIRRANSNAYLFVE